MGPVASGLGFAASLAALAFDAREHDEAWKMRGVLWDGNGGDAAPLETAVAALAFLVKSGLTKFIRLLDAQQCRAFMSRGSRTSRRIVSNVSIEASSNREALLRILFSNPRNTILYLTAIPLPQGEREKRRGRGRYTRLASG